MPTISACSIAYPQSMGKSAVKLHVAQRLNAGTVWVNTYDQSSMSTPFGGFKQSGFGRDRSYHAPDKYCDTKTIWSHYG